MQRPILILLFLSTLLTACGNHTADNKATNVDTSKRAAPDTVVAKDWAFENEQEYLSRKRQLCSKLALYDIEKGSLDYELRMWLIPSMWDPSILYVLKKSGSLWTLFHYQFYAMRMTDPNQYYSNPVVDSVVMQSVRPQRTNWEDYIDKLQLDSLWNLQTESSIKDKKFGMLDGHRYLLEFNKGGRYKYVFYTTPEYFQEKDINHKRFTEFKKRLVDPIIYKGMRNP